MSAKPNPGKAVARLLARRQADSERRELRKAGYETLYCHFSNKTYENWVKLKIPNGFKGRCIFTTRAEALAHCRRASKGSV